MDEILTKNYKSVELNFDELNGVLASLKYGAKEYVGAKIPIFEVAFRGKDTKQTVVNASEMKLTGCKHSENKILCKYEGMETSVSVSITVGEPLTWGIDVSASENKAVEWVKYPQIAVPDDFADNGGSSKILWGFNEGTLIENMTDRENGMPYFEPEYPCCGLMGVFPAVVETQFMAYYNEISGMYIAAHDNGGYLKAINPYRKYGGVLMEYRHFAGCDFGEDYKMPYEMVIEFFHGDWHDASDIYRKWFRANKKDDFVKIGKNKKIPHWYGESPVVVTYPVRGSHDTDVMTPNMLYPYTNVLPHIERLEQAFDSKIMVLLMHWEGTAPWAPPIVWPPYGDEDNFKELIKKLHERGDVFGVYCSGMGWTIKSNVVDDYDTKEFFYEHNLKDVMCISPNLELPYSNICTDQRVGYDMCPKCGFTKEVLKEQVMHMVDADIDYIQLLDQNHGGTSYFCYSREHNHPPVPGVWQVDEVKKLLREINRITGDTLLGCESAAAESYIPNLLFSDNRFELTYFIGRPVPAYSYIYHEYVNNFEGNQVHADSKVDYDSSPEAFYERMGYSFSAGDMLTAVINEDGDIDWNWGKADKTRPVPNQKNAQKFIKNLNFWRINEPKYLNTGEMIKPINVKCGKHIIMRTDKSKIELPEIHTSAWRSQNGDTAQFLINYLDSEKECSLDFGSEEYILKTDSGEENPICGLQKIKIKPFSVVMLEKKK